ncbi:MAG: hypothetical protein ACYCW6_17580 [Candidatus Xenobia bacterium]
MITSTPAPRTFGPIRRAVETVSALPGFVVGAAINTLPAAVAGGVEGVAKDIDADGLRNLHLGLVCFQGLVGGGAAGLALGGPVGAAAGAVGGLVLSAAYAGMAASGDNQVGAAIKQAVDAKTQMAPKTDRPVRDATRDATTGVLVGAVAGLKAGGRAGGDQARGVTGGVLDGLRGAARVFTGAYEPDVPQTPPPPQGVLHRILGIPRSLAEVAVGSVAALAGGALETVDGALQGLVQGVAHEKSSSTVRQHLLLELELIGIGVATGAPFPVAGPFIGVLAGLVAAAVANHLAAKSGADRSMTARIATNVAGAQAENIPGSKTYNAFRDGVQGTIVGGAAGFKAGTIQGYQAGEGLVDGVIEGAKGIVSGLVHGLGPAPAHQGGGKP